MKSQKKADVVGGKFMDIAVQKSATIYWMRTIAIIAVISSHATYLRPTSHYLYRLSTSFSNAGVAIFFFAAGVYWRWRPLKEVHKHIQNLLVPWIFCGLLVYGISVMPHLPTIGGAIMWLIGRNTYLWYLTIYTILIVLFSLFKIDNTVKLAGCVFITLISRVMTAVCGISGAPAFLNVANWCGFFALGQIVAQSINSFFAWKKACWIGTVGIVGIIVFTWLDIIYSNRFDYWSLFAPFEQICWIMTSFSISCLVWKLHGYELGHMSLPIYLLHIPLVGFISARLKMRFWGVIVLSITIAVFIFGLIKIGERMSHKLKLHNAYKLLLGVK